MQQTHQPVLPKEVLQYLDPQPDKNMIDGTVGEGGHAASMLERMAPHGILLGIDADPTQIENSTKNLEAFAPRTILICDSYVNMAAIARDCKVENIKGILLDVGYSSWQIEDASRGFSFLKDGPLDMRYGKRMALTAEKIVNEWPEKELERIITEYGEEKFSKKIAQHIVTARQQKRIESTLQLVEIIRQAVPQKFQHGRIHYATRTFQALRIAVNHELGNVQHGVLQAIELLAPGGRLVVISFHSLEDRIVKTIFRQAEQEGKVAILTKKLIEASDEEIAQNPRSRSAKLRAIVKK